MLNMGHREIDEINMLILPLKEIKGVFTSNLLYLTNHQLICFFVTFVFREIDKSLFTCSHERKFQKSAQSINANNSNHVQCVVFISREVNRGTENALK